MRHLHKGRILSREAGPRRALVRNLAQAFFTHKRIRTTVAKAKELRPFVEKMITHAKIDTLARKRLVAKNLSPELLKKVTEVAKIVGSRAGGYTRITKLGRRSSDGAEMAIIELVK